MHWLRVLLLVVMVLAPGSVGVGAVLHALAFREWPLRGLGPRRWAGRLWELAVEGFLGAVTVTVLLVVAVVFLCAPDILASVAWGLALDAGVPGRLPAWAWGTLGLALLAVLVWWAVARKPGRGAGPGRPAA